MKLFSRSKEHPLLKDLKVAQSFGERAVGLLGHTNLESEQGMWIHRCNSIHTFFMRFAIDCVFVDRELRVVAIAENIQPWRLRAAWTADSVFEMKAGQAKRLQIALGEELHVGA